MQAAAVGASSAYLHVCVIKGLPAGGELFILRGVASQQLGSPWLSAWRQASAPTLLTRCAAAGAFAAFRGFSTTADDDSHDDFKPQVKAQPGSSVDKQIEDDIKSHNVFIYMKVRSASV